MDFHNVFMCRFTQLTGAVVEMRKEFPWSGSSVQCTSGMVLLLTLNFQIIDSLKVGVQIAVPWKYLICVFSPTARVC